ncbi:MAG: glycosyl hydrolase [Candidatus Lokiarchaeota archaeon]|nr:glycosyl hydrolase [Candidatus Lokiarchaeota archaeon]
MSFQMGATRGRVQVWLTDGYDSQKRLVQESDIRFRAGIGKRFKKIHVDASVEYQEILGFGASLTDSSAYLIHEVLNDDNYSQLMQNLFNQTSGIGLSYIRLPMGSSDCALTWYTYDDTAPDLADFSISHDETYIIPLILDALAINPDLKVMGSPFSAPGWMKVDNNLTDPTTKGLIGGRLNPSMYEIYADYFVKFIQVYESHDIDIDAVTLQNEPFHSPDDYPGMLMNVSEQIRFLNILGSAFSDNDISTKILILDHNWDLKDKVLSVLENETVRKYVSGVAWHGYSTPEPEIQTEIHRQYPEIDHYFTEVTGFNAAPYFHDNLAWLYENIFVGTIENWAKTALLWNLALDENGGPILRPYYDMRGVVTINQSDPIPEYEVEYYALGQMSKFIVPRARRIKTNGFFTNLDFVAFINPDGSQVLVVSNPTSENIDFSVRCNFDCFDYSLKPKSVVTFIWGM